MLRERCLRRQCVIICRRLATDWASARVVVGLHNLASPNPWHTVRVNISRTVKSPKFSESNQNGKKYSNDLMLIKLAHPIIFSDAVQPVCVTSLVYSMNADKRCYASSWGWSRQVGESDSCLKYILRAFNPFCSNSKLSMPLIFV